MPAFIGAYRSIYGRTLGYTSTGGIVSQAGSSGLSATSTSAGVPTMAMQMWGDAMIATTTSTGGATIPNFGQTLINTSATAATFLIAAPVAGVSKEIWVISSASALTFGGTSTSQTFMKVAGTSAGSTTVTLTDADLSGQLLLLRGLSATKWGIVNGSTVIQA